MLLEIATAACGALLLRQHARRLPVAIGEECHHKLNVVVTGSSRGLGLAMATEFVQRGDSVVISGRNAASVSAARDALLPLATVHPKQTVVACVCDVSKAEDCTRLAEVACTQLGSVDIWVNNAGVSQHPKEPLASTPPSTIAEVISTNLLGAIFGTRAAMLAMRAGGGTIFTLDGSGSRGNATPNSLAYGASKAALPQLAKTLAAETRATDVRVHLASPGMVTTDLLLRDAKPSALSIFNILAESPTTVAKWLVPRVRATHLTERPSGEYLKFLTPQGVAWRFATAPWRKNRLVEVPTS